MTISISSSVPLLLLIFFYVAMSPSVESLSLELSSSDIGTTCVQSIDRNFCLRVLNSTAGGMRAANFVDAGKVTLTAGGQKAREAEKYIRTLLAAGQGKAVKQSYKTCLGKYGDAIKSISVAKDALVTGDYDTAFTATTAAQQDAKSCSDKVKGLRASRLGEMNKYMYNLLDIVLVIVNMVGG